jgi:nucleotide-binding universal stress UspA family protein
MLTTIICATDLSHRSDRALERAAQLAGQLKLPLHVVSVIDPELPDTLWQAQKQGSPLFHVGSLRSSFPAIR